LATPDVFISYARNDAGTARRFAEAFEAEGLNVWWDNSLQAGEVFDEVIEAALSGAKAVVVLWSPDAVASRWVRAEATMADQNRTLVPAIIAQCKLPIVFGMTQTADLSGWDGDRSSPIWQPFLGTVQQMVGSSSPAAQTLAQAEPAKAPTRKKGASIIVLPFSNMSGDPEQEYFSDGITEDIITDLSKVSALSVISRNSAFTYKGKVVDIPEVARQLGVSHVMEGSVRKAGNRVRVTAQLIDGLNNDHVWAERYDRNLDDIFELQDELSQAIVKALKVRLLPEEKKAIEHRGTENVEAYNLFLMARQEVVNNVGSTRQIYEPVVRILRRAIDIDPGYADAWALLASVQAMLNFSLGGFEDDGLAAAKKALELDPHHAEAHSVMAHIAMEAGDVEAADTLVDKALQLGPESWEVNNHAATIRFRQGRFDEATTHYEKSVALESSSYKSCGMLMTCYRAQGHEDKVLEAARMTLERCEKVLAKDRNNAGAMAMGSDALAELGEQDRAKDWMNRAMLVDPDNLTARYNFACTLASGIGDIDGAIEMLKPALEKMGAGYLRHVAIDPDMDPLRDDPRFQAIFAEAEARTASESDS